MKKKKISEIILYIFYILSGAVAVFGIFKYSYPNTALRSSIAELFEKVGIYINNSGSEIIYSICALPVLFAVTVVLLILLREAHKATAMRVFGIAALIVPTLTLLAGRFLDKSNLVLAVLFFAYTVSFIGFAITGGMKIFGKKKS